jgi:hypothetical protein
MSNGNDHQLDLLIKHMAQQHQANLPSPSLVWWRAQIQRKLAEKQRIERPMVIVPIIAWVVCLAAVGGIAAWNWRDIAPIVSSGQVSVLFTLGSLAAAAVIMAGWLLREAARRS